VNHLTFLIFLFVVPLGFASAQPKCSDIFNISVDDYNFIQGSVQDRQTSQTTSFIKRQNDLFSKMWQQMKLSLSLEESLDRIKYLKSREVQDTLQALNADQLAITMIVPSSAREDIAKNGFLNMHATNLTRGNNSLTGRNTVEASFSDMSLSQYEKQSKKLKPKYAFLNPRVYENKKAAYIEHYGDDIFTFKTKSVEDQATYTIGDSLNYIASREEYINNSKENFEQGLLDKTDWMKGVVSKAESIYDVYIPFKYKSLISLFLKFGANPKDAVKVSGEGHASNSNLYRSPSVLKEFNLPYHFYNNSYIEVQIWGNLDLTQVESFTFRNRPPTGAFLKALKKYNIPIYDARYRLPHVHDRNYFEQDKIKLWDEASETGVYFESSSFGFGYWINPKSKKFKDVSDGIEVEAFQSSTGGKWVRDSQDQIWFEKPDTQHSELQTSAEAISSRIYRLFGFNVPETHKIKKGTKYFSVSKYIGQKTRPSNLADIKDTDHALMRILAAYLKDWDRAGNPNNNRVTKENVLYLIDFGGSLGARARGDFKDGPIISEAIGALDTGSNQDIYTSFKPDLDSKHPWMKVNKKDYLPNATRILVWLTDGNLYDIVREANFSRKEDEVQMFEILKQRRDNLVAELVRLSE